MKIIDVVSLPLPDLKIVRFARFHDGRGYFTEPFRRGDIAAHPGTAFLGKTAFPQSNESFSRAGVLRGLHFQWNPYMGKLVRTLRGRMIDLALDIRKGSPTFGKAFAYEMPSAPDRPHGEWIWVPPGFAHGNIFTEDTSIEYFCTGEYSPGCEGCVSPLAPDLDWSLCAEATRREVETFLKGPMNISDKDRAAPSLAGWSADPRSENFIHGRLS